MNVTRVGVSIAHFFQQGKAAELSKGEGGDMRGKYGLLTVVAVAVLAVGVASASAAPKPQTIRLLEVDTSFTGTGGFPTTSNGAPPMVGQGFISQATMYKWAGAKRGAPVGHLSVIGTITSIDPSRNTGRFHVDA